MRKLPKRTTPKRSKSTRGTKQRTVGGSARSSAAKEVVKGSRTGSSKAAATKKDTRTKRSVTTRRAVGGVKVSFDFPYDVCVSFAGEDRPFVQDVVRSLKRRKIRCFYDFDEQANLWGKDLYTHLDEVYRKKARYCVMFISVHYRDKLWPNHERQSIQARMFEDKEDYLLPVRLDDTEIPRYPPYPGLPGRPAP